MFFMSRNLNHLNLSEIFLSTALREDVCAIGR